MSTDNHSVFTLDPSTPIHPAARPFWYAGGPVGVLCVHGFGGSAGDYRSLAERLHVQGYSVGGVCLAGHGQTPAVLGQTTAQDWRASVAAAIQEMQSTCQQIILVGNSFGGVLAADAAAQLPDRVAGVVTINTGLSYAGAGPFQVMILHLLKMFRPNYPKKFQTPEARQQAVDMGSLLAWPIRGILETYRFIRQVLVPELSQLRQSLLVLVSPHDPVINVSSARQLYDRAGSVHKEFRELKSKNHNPLRDPKGVAEVSDIVQVFLNGLEARS